MLKKFWGFNLSEFVNNGIRDVSQPDAGTG